MTSDGSGPIERRCKARSNRTGQQCARKPIAGGDVCASHGGRAPQVKAAATRRLEQEAAADAVRIYGLPRTIAPDDALLEEVHRTAGHVSWLSSVVGELESKDRLRQYATGEGGTRWERPAVWVELYQAERKHLVNVCKAAITAGIAERQVQLAERQGELVGELLRVAIEAAQLTPTQRDAAYTAVRSRLALAG